MSVPVLLVHGIWMPRGSMCLLARRLRGGNLQPRCLAYPSLTRSVAANAAAFAAVVRALQPGPVRAVAHSLGGLVVLRALHDEPELALDRVVLLGSPLQGSALARRLAAHAPTRVLLGRSLAEGLAGGARLPANPPPVAMIAGTRALGVGRLFPRLLGHPNDGTVAVAETRWQGLAAHLELPVTHSGLLIDRSVAHHAGCFLRTGRFCSSQMPGAAAGV